MAGVFVDKIHNRQIGVRVRYLRKQRQLQQRDLAARAEVGVDSVVRVENGRDIRLSTLERIADALGTSLHALSAPLG